MVELPRLTDGVKESGVDDFAVFAMFLVLSLGAVALARFLPSPPRRLPARNEAR